MLTYYVDMMIVVLLFVRWLCRLFGHPSPILQGPALIAAPCAAYAKFSIFSTYIVRM